jgi:hypothetical protein
VHAVSKIKKTKERIRQDVARGEGVDDPESREGYRAPICYRVEGVFVDYDVHCPGEAKDKRRKR